MANSGLQHLAQPFKNLFYGSKDGPGLSGVISLKEISWYKVAIWLSKLAHLSWRGRLWKDFLGCSGLVAAKINLFLLFLSFFFFFLFPLLLLPFLSACLECLCCRHRGHLQLNLQGCGTVLISRAAPLEGGGQRQECKITISTQPGAPEARPRAQSGSTSGSNSGTAAPVIWGGSLGSGGRKGGVCSPPGQADPSL